MRTFLWRQIVVANHKPWSVFQKASRRTGQHSIRKNSGPMEQVIQGRPNLSLRQFSTFSVTRKLEILIKKSRKFYDDVRNL